MARQSKVLANEWALDVVHTVMAAIRALRKMGKTLTIGVMVVSYAHQSAFLYTVFAPQFSWNLFHMLDFAALLLGALLIPGLFDLAILYMIKVMGTVGLDPDARRWARRFLPAPVFMSIAVNVLASLGVQIPAWVRPWIIAGVFTMVVSLIAVIEFLHSKVGPHFPTINAIEAEALADAAEDEVELALVRELPDDPMMRLVIRTNGDIDEAKTLQRYDQMSPGDKQGWSRRYKNARTKWVGELANAPTSPAPIGS